MVSLTKAPQADGRCRDVEKIREQMIHVVKKIREQRCASKPKSNRDIYVPTTASRIGSEYFQGSNHRRPPPLELCSVNATGPTIRGGEASHSNGWDVKEVERTYGIQAIFNSVTQRWVRF